ncbi:MAG: beta-galactosidase [Chloroflexi bacterium]|nr:beta-galactosidase [Chloroflexota bacterium]
MTHARFGRGVLALVLLAAIALGALTWGTPVSPAAFGRATIPQSVVGVHTRLTDEVEEWKIERTLAMARAMGTSWIVEMFPWAYIEPEAGRFDWAHSDVVIRRANAHGLAVVARLDFVPAWARPRDTTPRYLGRERFGDYARFVTAFASRYQGAVRYYQIWNEPNTRFEWGFRPVDPDGYVDLLRLGYRAVKQADPDALVLGGALAPTLDQGDMAMNDLVFLQKMYDAGARDYFDMLSAHVYGFTFPPDAAARPDTLNFARVELLREVMVRNGDGAKQVLITEAGWNDHPRWTRAVRPGQRIAYTLRAYEKAATEWPWVAGVNIWAFRLPVSARNYNDYYTFVDPEFRPKPIYEAVRREHPRWARAGDKTEVRR